ncbi:MAG: hypothetical protein ACTS4Y_01950 [Candidatus Hodgkinia cicadicola]
MLFCSQRRRRDDHGTGRRAGAHNLLRNIESRLLASFAPQININCFSFEPAQLKVELVLSAEFHPSVRTL